MKSPPDISIPGAAYRAAANIIHESCDWHGRFDCRYQYDDSDVSHLFDLSGHLVLKPDVDGPFTHKVRFDRAEAETLDEDGIGLTNDFSPEQLEYFLSR